MDESLRSILTGTAGLGVIAVAALLLTLLRSPAGSGLPMRERAARLFLIGIAAQGLHFVEEFLARLYERWPQLLGLPAWPGDFFVAFNVLWIVLWIVSAVGVWAGIRAAFFPAWFFVLGMTLNGVAHPALALAAGGYFPGLITAPLVGVLGVVVWARLWRLTAGAGSVKRDA